MTEEELKDTPPEAEDSQEPGSEPVEERPEEDTEDVGASTVEEALGTLEEKLAETAMHLTEAEQKAAEYLDGWQRAQAAFANFRKRTEAEQSHWRSSANAQLLARLLPVLDDFKRAFEAIPDAYQDDPWLEGIRLVQRKVKAILDAESVTPIDLHPGDAFDPNLHQAVLYQEVEGFDEGEVVAEIETGYMLSDRVLRPSLVVVAKGSAKPAVDTAETVSDAQPEAETEDTAEA